MSQVFAMDSDKGCPIVSVVMAAYNTEKTIEMAIQSIVDQTYTNWEFVIIDDGSTDATIPIIYDIQRRCKKIKLISNKKNLGLAASLNKGIAFSKGKYIARMDADDESYPERLEKQIMFMQKHPEVDVLGTGAVLIGKQGEFQNHILLPETHDELESCIFKKSLFFHPSVMMKKRFLEKVGGYDEKAIRSQDLELWIKGFKRGYTYHNLQEPLLKYRTNNYQLSLKKLKEQFISKISIAFRYGYYFNGLMSALIDLIRGILVRYHLYKPISIRRVRCKVNDTSAK